MKDHTGGILRSLRDTVRLGAVIIAALGAMAGAQAGATPTNYVVNGSFEYSTATATGGGLYGWTVTTATGAFPGTGPQIITTDGVTKGPYGDVIKSDSLASPYPNADAGGKHAVYFVDDKANETISQRFYLPAGTYQVGFDIYAPATGYNNTYNALFSGAIAGTTITSASISSYPNATWVHFGANAVIQTEGYYAATFSFVSGQVPAKDIVVDNVYVVAAASGSQAGTLVTASVPEPASGAAAAVGVLALFALRKRFTS